MLTPTIQLLHGRDDGHDEYIRDLALGLPATALLYNSIAISVLGFVLQLVELTAELLKTERAMLRELVAGPGNWLPPECEFTFDRLGLPVPFRSMTALHLSSAGRTLSTTCPRWRDSLSLLKRVALSDHARYYGDGNHGSIVWQFESWNAHLRG